MNKFTYIFSFIFLILISFGLYQQRNLYLNIEQTPPVEFKGDISIDGNLHIKQGFLSPGCSPGKIAISGDLTFGNETVYEAELADLSGPGIGNDLIEAAGDLSLNGILNIILDGYIPTLDDQFEIMSFDGTLTGTFSSVNWPISMSLWEIDYGVLAPNKVTIYGPNSVPLPVNLLNFNVREENNQHVITWQTASEFNSDFFILEHSSDGILFNHLQRIPTQSNSSNLTTYSYTYETPEIGKNYYRLKQIDLDGSFTYSMIIYLWQDDKSSFRFYPNPAVNTLHFANPVQSFALYDSYGKEVVTVQNQTTELDISELPAGVYFLRFDGYDMNQKLIVTK